jgi:hypothetical protein
VIGVEPITYWPLARFRDDLVIEATSFYDSIAFNDPWRRVAPSAP